VVCPKFSVLPRSCSGLLHSSCRGAVSGVIFGCTLGLVNLLFINTRKTASESREWQDAVSSSGESAYIVDASNNKRADATTITIRGPDADGLLASMTTALTQKGCSLLEVHATSISQDVIEDVFVVQQGYEKRPFTDEELGDIVRTLHQATNSSMSLDVIQP